MLSVVSCLGVVPCLQVYWSVLKDSVCHNKIIGHAHIQQPGAIISDYHSDLVHHGGIIACRQARLVDVNVITIYL